MPSGFNVFQNQLAARSGPLLLKAMYLQQHKIMSRRAEHFDGPPASVLIEKIGNEDHDSPGSKIAHKFPHRSEQVGPTAAGLLAEELKYGPKSFASAGDNQWF